MKDHSIVRIHIATGLILMKLSRPMCKKVKGQNMSNFKLADAPLFQTLLFRSSSLESNSLVPVFWKKGCFVFPRQSTR